VEIVYGVIMLLVLSGFQIPIIRSIRSLKASSGQPVKEVRKIGPEVQHILDTTWIGDGNGIIRCWRWMCSCGVQGGSGDAVKDRNVGTEANAIKAFMNHAEGYKKANGNFWKEKHDELQMKFDAYVDKCYCKETHRELKSLEGI
jgi:hypothetical protein